MGRLFIGGFWRIRLQSILLISTKNNFANVIRPLYYLDAMLTGNNHMSNLKISKSGKALIEHLFRYKTGQSKMKKEMDTYLYELFEGYIQNKEHIMINLYFLEYAEKFMYDLIAHSIEEDNELEDDDDKTNLIRQVLADVFRDSKTVHIDGESSSYSFSLIGFLSVLQTSQWQKVTISGEWISDLWQSPKCKQKLLQSSSSGKCNV